MPLAATWTQLEIIISSVQFSRSVVSDSLRPHESHHSQASLSITNSPSLLKLMSIESVMPSSHLILCVPCILSQKGKDKYHMISPIPPMWNLKYSTNEPIYKTEIDF